MINFFNILIDFVFPPRDEELKIRSISPEEFFKKYPKSGKTEFPFIESIFTYKDPIVRELIWQIKYKKNDHAVKIAGFALYNELIKITQNVKSDVLLLPIPISNKRRKERGYNQCEIIINEILRLDSYSNRFETNFSLIKRMKHIEKQTFMKRNERLKNIENIFEVTNNNLNKNTKIIIIDDVSTTGSTLNEARETLLQAGFADVQALTIAH